MSFVEMLYDERNRHIDAVEAIDLLLEIEESSNDAIPESEFHCTPCNRDFETQRGLSRHITVAHAPQS